jgi:N-methylhydantoinase B
VAVVEPIEAIEVSGREVDPVTVSTIWFSLQRTCREMRLLLYRTGQSFTITQSKDVSTGIWDAAGRTMAIPAGITPHFLGGKYSVEYVLQEYAGQIYPGDVFLSNDPYRGYTCHPSDWGFFRPIFHDGRLVFWTMCRTHMEDTGAAFPGAHVPNPYDVYAEGLLIPALKIIERDQDQTEVLKLIWNNIRRSENVRIDSLGAIAATRLCETRLIALLDRYGADTVLAALNSMIARTERVARSIIGGIPDGVYGGQSSTDDDGVVRDTPVTVRVQVIVRGDELTLDFSGSDPQQKGYVNATHQVTASASMAALALFMGPDMADYQNEGLMRPVRFVNPAGRVTNCQFPAPCAGAPINVGQNITESVMAAMSDALPERAAAGWGRRYGQEIDGYDPQTGRFFLYSGYEAEGGSGAVYGFDGYHGTSSIATLAQVVRPNTEDIEHRYPFLIRQREFRVDSCGAGRWRGGAGFVWEAENLAGECGLQTGAAQGETTFSDGALGGCPTQANVCYILSGDQRTQARVHRVFSLHHGDRLLKLTSGGGGVGPAHERDPQAVWDDVYVNEIVSIEAARAVYHVAIDPETRAIDWHTTRALRSNPRPRCAPGWGGAGFDPPALGE